MSICSKGEALGGIAERPLTCKIRIISGVAGTSFDVPAAAYNGECGGLGAKPPEARVQGRLLLLGVGKAHGLSW